MLGTDKVDESNHLVMPAPALITAPGTGIFDEFIILII